MKEYIFYSPKFEGEIHFSYNEDGYLCKFEIKAKLNEKQFIWLIAKFPFFFLDMNKLKTNKNISIKEVEPDLSFERFWSEYGHKVGKLKMTKNIWDKMPSAHKIIIFEHIPIYKAQCIRNSANMAYPSTYLNQEYWNC